MEINYLPIREDSYATALLKDYPDIFTSNELIKEISFQVTEDCCLKCTYCYQFHKKNIHMSYDVIYPFLKKLLNNEIEQVNTSNTKAIVLHFIGGEPLMEMDLITKICDYVFSTMIVMNHPWLYFCRISLGSNGILYFNKNVQDFLFRYRDLCSFTISIDGNKKLHDSCRIDYNGQGSYDRAMKAVMQYKKDFGFIPNTKLTFSKDNIFYIYDSYVSLIELGYTQLLGGYVFEEGWTFEHGKILYEQLKKISDYIIYNNLYNKIYIPLFQEDACCPLSPDENNNWCGGVGDHMLAIDVEGNYYPCIRYMESSLQGDQPPLIVGNIKNGFKYNIETKNNWKKLQNITRRSQSTDECFYCPVATGCSWCSGYNYQKTGTPNKRVTYICPMHKARVLANVYFWNTLYKYLNINKKFHNYLPKEDALKIISEEEYNFLQNIGGE